MRRHHWLLGAFLLALVALLFIRPEDALTRARKAGL